MVQIMTKSRKQHRKYIKIWKEISRQKWIVPWFLTRILIFFILLSLYTKSLKNLEGNMSHIECMSHIMERLPSIVFADFNQELLKAHWINVEFWYQFKVLKHSVPASNKNGMIVVKIWHVKFHQIRICLFLYLRVLALVDYLAHNWLI